MAENLKNGPSPKAAGHNGYDPEKVKHYVAAIEEQKEEIASIMGRAVNECKGPNKEIKDLLDEAKAGGIPKGALRAVIKARELERKAEKAREDLEPDDQESYDQIRHALGDLADLPLGEVVAKRAPDFQDDQTGDTGGASPFGSDDDEPPAKAKPKAAKDKATTDAAVSGGDAA